MKDVKLYVYSHDSALMNWLSFLVEKEGAGIFLCSTEQELDKLYQKEIPDILLIDDHQSKGKEHSTAELIDIFVPRKKRGASMVLVLSPAASDVEYRVDLLLKGADYIIKKPVNMIELIARIIAMIRHQKYVQERIHDYVSHTRDIATFDTMEKIMGYLSNHIKPHVEYHVEMARNYNPDTVLSEEYIEKIKNDGMEVLALINAIREDVHEFISARSNQPSDYDHFEQLFKKNIDLIHMAYDGYTQAKKDEL